MQLRVGLFYLQSPVHDALAMERHESRPVQRSIEFSCNRLQLFFPWPQEYYGTAEQVWVMIHGMPDAALHLADPGHVPRNQHYAVCG
jgi:hypothetical protein